MHWDPDFIERSPMLEPLRARAADLRHEQDWPTLERLQDMVTSRNITTAGGAPLRLVSDAPADAYEVRIRTRGEMHVRNRQWHDLLNVLVWLTYPRTKAAVNDAQFAALRRDELSTAHARSARGPVRDALTLFDENGLIVLASDDSLLDDVRAFRWKQLFWQRRQEVLRSMRFFVFGHALFEKALRPYIGMTAHALLFSIPGDDLEQPLPSAVAAADALASATIDTITTPRSLSPVPVLGVPGWCMENENAAFYDNADYFRNGRQNT